MNAEEIKAAVRAGKTVCWANAGYKAGFFTVPEGGESWYINCTFNNHSIGLTHRDGVTLNGKESDFFILEEMLTPTNYRAEAGEEYWKTQLANDMNWVFQSSNPDPAHRAQLRKLLNRIAEFEGLKS